MSISPPSNKPPQGPIGRFAPRPKIRNTKATIKRIWDYLSDDRLKLFLALLCVITNTVFSLIASYMVRPIINDILDGKGVEVLIQNMIFMFFVYIISVLAFYTQTKIMLQIAQKSLEKMRCDLFDKLQKLPLSYYDTTHHGELMSRFTNDIDVVSQMLSTTFVQLVAGIISMVGTLGFMLFTSWELTLITLAMLPLFHFAIKMISKRSRGFYKGQQQSIGELNGFMEEIISGQKVVKVFHYEDSALEEFDKLNQQYRDKVIGAQFAGAIMGPTMGCLGQINYTLTALVAGLFCVLRGFDVGGFTIFVNYSKSFNRPISDISGQMTVIYSALAGAERVFDVMDQEPEPEDLEDAVVLEKMEGNVVIHDVNFAYRKDKPILKHISLYAKPSQKIAFVGSTGAGKTTITNLLNRFYEIEGGNITIDGIDITHFKKSYLRKNIATVLQDAHLFTGTVRENIRYGRLDATDEEVVQAARTANAHDFIQKLAQGYDTVLSGDGNNLSQGQRQLLTIARAAISHAPILVLDEATSSVDTRTEKHIQVALDRLMESRTTLVIAHRLSTVQNATAIMVLEQGEIIERGTHQELLDLQGKYYHLYTGNSALDPI